MDNETELLRVKEKLLGDLSAGLGVVQVVSCESSQKVRSQISHVKLLWKQLSKCFGSLKSIYAANGKDREVRKLTLEKQSLAAKVGAAVLNLNDVLDGMGEDLESSFAGSTTSSLVDGAAGVDLDVGNTTSGDLGKTTPSVIRNPPCTRARVVLPCESSLLHRLTSAVKELKRWLTTAEIPSGLPPTVASLYYEELGSSFSRYRKACLDLTEFHRRRGETTSVLQLQKSLSSFVARCDQASAALRGWMGTLHVSKGGSDSRGTWEGRRSGNYDSTREDGHLLTSDVTSFSGFPVQEGAVDLDKWRSTPMSSSTPHMPGVSLVSRADECFGDDSLARLQPSRADEIQ